MATKAKKSTTKQKKAPKPTKTDQHAKKQMWAVVLFALGLLIGALTYVKGDKLWLFIHNVLFGIFGWSVFFFAPLIIYIAVIAAMDRPLSTIKNKLWQVAVLIFMISAAIQIFGSGLPDEGKFLDDMKTLFEQGKALSGGGIAAALFAYPLLGLFEKTGAGIIIILCIFVFAMLVTGSTLIGLFRSAARPVKGIEDAYAATVENRRERQEAAPAKQRAAGSFAAANSPRFDIDVDISKDSLVAEPLAAKPPWVEPDPVLEPEPESESEPQKPDLPGHPVVAEKIVPFPAPPVFSPDSPVEYISADEFRKAPEPAPPAEPAPEPERRHSLDDDILRAERETDDEIGGIIERFLNAGLDGRQVPAAPQEPGVFDKDAILAELGGAAPAAEQVFEPVKEPVQYVEEAPMDFNERDFSAVHFDDADEPDMNAEPEQIELQSIPAFADPPAENRPPYVYRKPPISLLHQPKTPSAEDVSEELKSNAEKLVDTLKSFGVQTRITDICRGPAVTRYELQPSAGVKISKITGLSDDIALNLASAGIRIEAPIPNKAAVGIEVPNKVISMVSIREIIDSNEFGDERAVISAALGKDIAGNITLADIGKMPHVLIAGSTGSGKSVCINSLVISMLYKYSPDEIKFLMVDPKVVELGVYNGIPHLLVPVVTDPKKAAGALNWAVAEMLRRYKEFAALSVKNLEGYNQLAKTRDDIAPMPKIVIIIDELADLMMAASNEVEDSICRLAQMARAAGMHLVIATQRPSVDVITGIIKANIPSRIAFAVSSQIDSRTILDMGGAEKLLGRGDMLFYPVGASKPQRVQGCFVTDAEVERVVDFIKEGASAEYDQQIVEDIESHVIPEKNAKGDKDSGGGFNDEDEMLPQAIEVVVEAGMASTSLLQRRLKLGYARAARIVDQLEERGIVGPFEGSKPRQVLISKDRWIEMKLSQQD